MKTRLIRLLLCLASLASCASIAAPLGTAFTYQGRLQEAGQPAHGRYDFLFRLYNAPTGGSQVGANVFLDAVPVSNGLFGVEVDFGHGAFGDEARWLQISVQAHGGVRYTSLTPRQALTPAPSTLYSLAAGLASSATTAGSLTGSNLTAAAEGDLTLTARNIAIESDAFVHTIASGAARVVGANSSEMVGGHLNITVGGTHHLNTGSDVTATLGRHLNAEVIGDCVLGVGTNLALGMGGVLTVDAGDEILLQTGEASIRMLKNGDIAIRGKDITIQGSGSINMHSNMPPAATRAGSQIGQTPAILEDDFAANAAVQPKGPAQDVLKPTGGAAAEARRVEAPGHRSPKSGTERALEALRRRLAQQEARLAALEKLLGNVRIDPTRKTP